MTILCKSNSDLELRSKVNKYYVQNQTVSEEREKSSIPVGKNLHNRFLSSTISCCNVYTSTQVVSVIELWEVQLQLAPGPPLSLKLPKVT